MLLNGPWQAYLNLSLVSLRFFLIPDTLLRCERWVGGAWTQSYSSLGKLHQKKPDWQFIILVLVRSLDLIHPPESIHHCCLCSHLLFLGLLWRKLRGQAPVLQQGTGAFIWCKCEPKLWRSRGVWCTNSRPLTTIPGVWRHNQSMESCVTWTGVCSPGYRSNPIC